MLDCLTDLKELFQRFVDGQSTFEELKNAVSREVISSNDTAVRDFLIAAHRGGLLSNTHFKTLITEISCITGVTDSRNPSSKRKASAKQSKKCVVLNNRFVLGEVIGKGGMGTVYKARDMRKMEANDSDDIVAIKILSKKLRAHPESITVLQREAKKAQKLAHPNVVTVYDFDRHGEVAYMTMEYLDGTPLSEIIKTRAPIPRKEAIRIIDNIASGLSYAHKHKIVHSDLKPDNIFLLADGTAKILDFGIARAVKINERIIYNSTSLDSQAFTALTPAYASCEMFESMPPAPQDDIYALGCVAHELLTGKHPYVRMSAAKAKEKKQAVARDKNLTVYEYRAIMHAVELDKERRINSVDQFIRELNGEKTTLSISNIWVISLVFVTFIILGAFYAINKIKAYEEITARQAIIVNRVEISDALKQADLYIKSGKLLDLEGRDALSLYQRVLKLEPGNQQAESGIEAIQSMYAKKIDTAISSNQLNLASDLFKTMEKAFPDNVELQRLKDDLKKSQTEKQIDDLISKAIKEEEANNYLKPKSANAYDTYLKVLELIPDEPRAREGLLRIKKSILSETGLLIEKGELVAAKSRVKDALLVSPGDEDAVAMFNKIKALTLADRYQEIQNNNTIQARGVTEVTENNTDYLRDLKLQLIDEQLDSSQQVLVESYIKQADMFVGQDILFGSGEDNAAYYYKQILMIDSSNAYAKSGLSFAWKALQESARNAAQINNYSDAIKMLEMWESQFSDFYGVDLILTEILEQKEKYLETIEAHYDVALLLAKANSHVNANRWTMPKGNNAMETYLEVLKIEPENKEANSGLNKIKDIFAKRVTSDIQKENWERASKILQRALYVFPKSTKLKKLTSKLSESKKKAEQKEMDLQISEKIKQLFNDAKLAHANNRYIFPKGDNAYEIYSNIASIDPGNIDAIRGLNEAKLIAFSQIEAEITSQEYQLAARRLERLSELGVRDRRYNALRAKMSRLANDAEQSETNQ